MKKWQSAALITAAAVIVMPFLVWIFAIPPDIIPRLVERQTARMGVEASVQGFRKGTFFNFRADSLTLSVNGSEVASFHDLKGGLNPLKLYLLKLEVPVRATLGGGTIKAKFLRGLSSQSLDARLAGADMGGMAALKNLIKGKVSGQLAFRDNSGTMKFQMSGMDVPPLGIKNALGLAFFGPKGIELKSVSLEGDGVYAKLKGTISGGAYNLTAEVMPDNNAPGAELLKMALAQYESSPGYYVILVSGRLQPQP